ncbi:MFS transporter [Paenibacillus sp. N1-5-1-14]|uniref:MFS transporter n=1 Tax=Paenibacillus radicibacter TaxID=2972488 RepID=UPI002158ADAC|nr:MFS transporter [Paenibacillus radicibacter]MCR8642646.1 MFS transporter [Paenibacillus radicibacter]
MDQSPTGSASRLWTREFILFTISNMLLYLNLQMITPSLPAYVASAFDVSSVWISLIISVFAFAAILTRLFVGKALSIMSPKRVLIIGLIVYLLSTIFYYFAGSVAMILVIRVLYGISFGIVSTAYGTVVSDIVPNKRMGEGIGYFGLSTSFSMSIAPMIGLWLLGQFGFHTVIEVATLLILLIFPLFAVIRFPSGPLQAEGEPASMPHNVPKPKMMDKRLLLPFVLNMFFTVTYGGLITFITLFGKEVSIANVGWFFLFNAVTIILVRPFSGKLFDRKGHIAVLPLGAALIFTAMILLSFISSTSGLIVAALIYGMGSGLLQPSLQAWMIQRVEPELRGTANGAFYNSLDLGIAMGSLCLGTIATSTSYAMMYRISAFMMVVFIVVYLVVLMLERKARPQLASTRNRSGHIGNLRGIRNVEDIAD